MFSLRQLFGKQDRFFDLLQQCAAESRESVKALAALIKTAEANRNLDEFIVSRRRGKRAFDELHTLLATSFETGIEREDVGTLSVSLYRIPKTLEKVAERIDGCPVLVRGVSFERQIKMLDRATEVLAQMVESMSNGMQLETVKTHNDELQKIEGDADKLMLELLRDLYSRDRDAESLVFLKDLYELIEKAFDRCRDAGNVITQVVLKNS